MAIRRPWENKGYKKSGKKDKGDDKSCVYDQELVLLSSTSASLHWKVLVSYRSLLLPREIYLEYLYLLSFLQK